MICTNYETATRHQLQYICCKTSLHLFPKRPEEISGLTSLVSHTWRVMVMGGEVPERQRRQGNESVASSVRMRSLYLKREAAGLPTDGAGRVATRGDPRGGRGDEGLRGAHSLPLPLPLPTLGDLAGPRIPWRSWSSRRLGPRSVTSYSRHEHITSY